MDNDAVKVGHAACAGLVFATVILTASSGNPGARRPQSPMVQWISKSNFDNTDALRCRCPCLSPSVLHRPHPMSVSVHAALCVSGFRKLRHHDGKTSQTSKTPQICGCPEHLNSYAPLLLNHSTCAYRPPYVAGLHTRATVPVNYDVDNRII